MLISDVVAPIQSVEEPPLSDSEDGYRRSLSARAYVELFLRCAVVMLLLRRSFSDVLAAENGSGRGWSR